MLSDKRFADQATRDRLWKEAARLAHRKQAAPTCHCGRRMRMDDFNGMWHCFEEGHGGYQTRSQVEGLFFNELLMGEGYDHE